jgi:hypothetical protein
VAGRVIIHATLYSILGRTRDVDDHPALILLESCTIVDSIFYFGSESKMILYTLPNDQFIFTLWRDRVSVFYTAPNPISTPTSVNHSSHSSSGLSRVSSCVRKSCQCRFLPHLSLIYKKHGYTSSLQLLHYTNTSLTYGHTLQKPYCAIE